MKKLGILFGFLVVILFALSQSTYYKELIILNWQDYLSQDLIQAFEEENDCIVTELTVTSNEQMYANVLNRKAPYDLVVPSDYMIDKMYKEDLLLPINYDLLTNYEEDMYVPELTELMSDKEYKDHFVPYFWGSLCIMYNVVNYPEIGEIIEEHGFNVFFEPELLPSGAKVAMYDSSRDAFAAAELYLGYSLNTTDKTELDKCAELLKERQFTTWGTDELKIGVASGNLDVALMYSGDFFDVFYADDEAENGRTENYGVWSPVEANNVFYDGLVIPVTSGEPELAHKFLDFMMDFDNNYVNTENVGYCPTLNSVYEDIMSDEEGWGYITEIQTYSPVPIIHTAKEKAEVYLDLGDEAFRYMEKLYQEVRFL